MTPIKDLDPTGPFLLTGASGWFGRTALWEFERLWGPEALRRDLIPFASTAKTIDFGSPHGPVEALPLHEIQQVSTARGLLHLAFLTRERIVTEGLDNYVRSNQAITRAVSELIDRLPTMPIITTSSGATAALDGMPADLEGNPYATLKQEEETLWKQHASERMALVFRVYAASGRFLKDPSIFALGDFIAQAKAGRPITIRSPRAVIRTYVHVGTLMRLAWAMLLQPLPSGFLRVDAGTHTLSLVDLANLIASHWDLPPPLTMIDTSLSPDDYSANIIPFLDLLERYHLKSPSMEDQIQETAKAITHE
jgi:nucleoside-diphosphate-sugar epimerase